MNTNDGDLAGPTPSRRRHDENPGGGVPQGHHLEVAEVGDRVRVTITATPQACADCLLPGDLMRGILGQAFGIPPDTIDLTYPSTSEQER